MVLPAPFTPTRKTTHGFDEKGRKAKLRLDVAESAYTERNGFTPLKPGDLANSEVWQRITSTDEEEMMPPPKEHARLSDAQIATHLEG